MHEITRVRKDVVRRQLTVASRSYVTPRMLRVVFQSDELAGFESPSPDDHIKIFLPATGEAAAAMRDFTPRSWDAAAGTFTLDFALHHSGPATEWASHVKVGDTLTIGGPRGSTVVEDDFDWYLLVGDATALPSIGRRLQTLRKGVPVTVMALIADDAEQQELATASACKVQWITASGHPQQDTQVLRAALENFAVPAGDGFVWIACETSAARELYQFVVETMKHPRQWVKAAGYWSLGQADKGERIE